jgi:diadenosine tetraphosphatase ApaH/serine/threonine PP2A family protein phosphatase
MILVESGGDAGAIGDGGRALGVLQIHAGVTADVNQYYHTTYKHEDALDHFRAVRICRLYLAMHAPRGATPEIYARIWNGGPNGHQKDFTLKYRQKVEVKYLELIETRKNLQARK